MQEAKTTLSELLRRVAAGEEVTITRSGKPVAQLVRIGDPRRRVFGSDEGLFDVPGDFDAPLPDDVLSAFQE